MKKTSHLLLFIGLSAFALSGCSSLSKLTIQENKGAGGEKIVVGQYKPKEENAGAAKKTEKQGWGLSGHFNPIGTRGKIVKSAVETAPKEKANYVYMDIPAQVTVMGIPLNLFSKAEVTYYDCKKVPA